MTSSHTKTDTEFMQALVEDTRNQFANANATAKNSVAANLPTISIVESRNSKEVLDNIGKQLERLECEKYPNPPYEYYTHTYEGMNVTYIKSSHQQALSASQLALIEKKSLAARKLSILGGIATHLDHSGYISTNPAKREKVLAIIIAMEKEALSDKPMSIDAFLNELSKRITKETGIRQVEAVDIIRKSERYFVADYNSHRVLINELDLITPRSGEIKKILQIDTPLSNGFPDSLKKEFFSIRSADKPTWFKKMQPWEQAWLLEKVPQDLAGDWEKCEQFFQSSAMQNIPGIKNARRSYLISVNDENAIEILSANLKTSSFVPQEMVSDEQMKNAKLNAEQVITSLDELARENQQRIFQDNDENKKPLSYIHMLLSDVRTSPEDTHLANVQIKAIEETLKSRSNRGPRNENDTLMVEDAVVTGNDPTNFLRRLIGKGFISSLLGRKENKEHIERIHKQHSDTIDDDIRRQQNEDGPSKSIRLRLAAIGKIKELDTVGFRFFTLNRNKSAYRVAYQDLLVEAMGGAVSTNCKSGKDRTGYDEMYRNAMLIYFDLYGTLPGYDDKGPARENFIAIFVQLFNSMKIQEAAATNTPGSFGVKDSAKVLCGDIAARLKESYTQSSKRANLNKPKLFTVSERLEKKRLKEQDDEGEGRKIKL